VRLTNIKLAGFKSFVDPTTISVPGQLVGVVGPNGCGKSNVIDAVRWVLGESSAKNLRGEKMEDVIFNGSLNRKPSARASVELVFDNSLGRIGGQWGQYAELSVKRVLTRDGNSDYYINGQHVRRRDITDVFLGTGLGPRAYAIIEQGMISRVITSKPEELRIFLEEVAGVSKYRERRKETEARLEDSKENLNRVDDILGELSKNVEKLTEQAAVAAKYQAFHTELKLNENLWAYTKQREARAAKERYANEIIKTEVGFEGETARLREVEAALDKLRQEHYTETDQLTTAQAAMFEANTSVVQLEQEINYLGENRRRLGAQVDALALQVLEIEANRDATVTELDRWHRELANGIDKVGEARERAEALREQVPQFEEKVREAVATVKLTDNEVRNAESEQALNESREANALKILSQLEQRKSRLTTENMALVVPEEGELERVEIERAEALEALAMVDDKLLIAEKRVAEFEHKRRAQVDEIGNATRELARIEAALLALQNQQARMDNNNRLAMWLSKYGLDNAPRLWQAINIKAGWEDALESALGLRLNAMKVVDTAVIDRIANDAPPGAVSLYLENGQSQNAQQAETLGLVSLSTLVTSDKPSVMAFVHECLANIFVLENESEARQKMSNLPFGAVLVTSNGHLYSQHGVTFHGPQSELHGVLQRQREIESLKADLPNKIEARHVIESAQKEIELQLADTQDSLRKLRQEQQETKNREHILQMEGLKLTQAISQAEGRRGAILEETALIDAEIEAERGEMAEAQAALEEGGNKISEITDKLMVLEDKQREAERALNDARERVNAAERGAQEANYFERSCHDKIKSMTEMVAQLAKRWDAVTGSRGALVSELDNLQEGNIRERLQAALNNRIEAEKALAAARDAMDSASGKLKELEDQRHAIEQSLQPLRDKMTELRMKEQEARINEETFTNQLTENGANFDELALLLNEAVEKKTRSTAYQAEINRLNGEITALGAVNMAALQELEQASVRKEFLDAQSTDLKEAIDTLESAIKRIDRETRDMLQATFDTVNKNFMELFPELFGGGNAYLRLTGEEILDSGVQVFAQPPGKKNSSIQLLSGGEKALTALSLVFSLFRLNPAPFCLLDEVDAPLDDSNTDRFCELVKKMSASTQFLFITHNKVTMEMGEQLVGVTMNEPGCSRIVEVDIEAAKKFAASAPGSVVAVAA
jgi:chromosome segregation protein